MTPNARTLDLHRAVRLRMEALLTARKARTSQVCADRRDEREQNADGLS